MTITIVGLGPGDAGLITRHVWHLLSVSDRLYLRTSRHPAVSGLPEHLQLRSFDKYYQSEQDFANVYARIAEEVVRLGTREPIIYGVPGNPFVGEATVTAIIRAANVAGIEVRTLPGLSFVEASLAALKVDALDGLQIFDAIEVAATHYPSIDPDVPVLLGQVYSRILAGELKLTLLNVYPAEHRVALVHSAGQSDEVIEWSPLYAMDRSDQIDHLTSLYIPALPFKGGLPALADTVAVLRGPDGCPWDQEQTPQSMREGFLEEAYEVLAALDAEDSDNLREELGDLLYHIVMQAQMASEGGEFTLSDIIAGIEAKLRRRHPHVWGDWQASDSAEVLRNWEILKQQERLEAQATGSLSRLDGILAALPALIHSQKIQARAAATGFDWPDLAGVYDKLDEELAEMRAASTPEELRLEVGDVLFVMVNLAQWLGVEAESALREANARFVARFQLVEKLVSERKLEWNDLGFTAMEALWAEAKAILAKTDLTDTVEGSPE